METIEITARYISENARMNFMPAAFRGAFFSADHFIQSFLNRYAKDYQGGYWEYLQASNGAFFMDAPQPLWLSLPNYFEGECSAREVGIIVCLYAYSYFCGLAYEEGKAELNETMANRYHLLREYVNTLENESQNRIYRAID
ncbi:antirestriction protein [Escherichia coli]|uniref:antirestriction protein ArdB n=1 Tax=Escherichia coli TaxID=562 RepID=UPI0013D14FF4|nr:antirestriction protein ArdB [Escherichia coli]EHI7500458.1 antirestriction protein [Salmonella enterica]HAS0874376.1 antirestriction protein [Enterobacter hormaechei subsp. xiangfangensis]HCJ0423770.1 antirestriction protein [Salmonella enterica subsp. enterica serovar Infantis]EHI9054923.1 antirestriction protein [Salmonella enterica]NGE71918.1 antirestriction protein [Escherichia coli]